MDKTLKEENVKTVNDSIAIDNQCAEKNEEKTKEIHDCEEKTKEKKPKYMSEADAYYLMFGIDNENVIDEIRESLKNAEEEDYEYLAFQMSHLAHTKEHDVYETEITLLFYVCISYLCTRIRKQDRTLEGLYRMFDGVNVIEKDLIKTQTLDIMIKDTSKSKSILMYYKQLREMSGEYFNKVCIAAKSILFPYVADSVNKVKFYGPLNIEECEEKAKKRSGSARCRFAQEYNRNDNKPIADPTVIKAYLDKSVVGQEEAKRSLSIALANHLCAYYNGTDAPRGTTMIIGPTGSGKTFLAEKLSEYSNLPISFLDCTQLTGDGWYGLSKSEPFRKLYENNDPEVAKYGIVVLDEFDKLLDKSQLHDTFGHDAISAALGMLDGTPIMDSNNKSNSSYGSVYQTKNILFILTGSFEKMNISESNPIGFDGTDETTEVKDMRTRLIEYGVMPEIVGRLSSIVSTELLSEEEILTAILDKDDSYIQQYQNLVKNYDKEIQLEREYVADLVHTSMKNKLGVRGAKNTLSDKIREALYTSFENHDSVVRVGCN